MASDYSHLGLDPFLKAIDSPGSRGTNLNSRGDYVTNTQFDANYEGLSASKLTSGNIRGVVDIGNNAPLATTPQPYIRLNGTSDQIQFNNGTTNIITMDAANSRILFNDGTNNRMYFGNNNGTIAMKLSQSGFDVLTAADSNLIWSSDFNSFKIAQLGIITFNSMPTAGNVLLGTHTHNLGYKPVVIAGGTATSSSNFMLPYHIFLSSGLLDINAQVNAIGTDICTVQIAAGTGNVSQFPTPFVVRLYYLKETIT